MAGVVDRVAEFEAHMRQMLIPDLLQVVDRFHAATVRRDGVTG